MAFERRAHPPSVSKFPSYAPCVVAFQKVSFAYQTLSKPSSRRLYDVSGRTDLAAALNDGPNGHTGAAAGGLGSDETLNSVLYSVFCEFLDGDFEMIRVLVNAMNESNPGLNLGEDAVDSIEGAFAKLRDIMLGEFVMRSAVGSVGHVALTRRTFLGNSGQKVPDHHPLRADSVVRDPAVAPTAVLL